MALPLLSMLLVVLCCKEQADASVMRIYPTRGSTCGLTAEQLGYAVILGIDLCDNVLSAP